jgi:CRP-like cAMP-binding protein
MEQITKILGTKINLPPSRIREILSISKVKSISRNEYFIEAGTVPRKFGFVISGLFRYLYISDKGVEFTKGIISEHNFISSYSAMRYGNPSYFFVEALEDSEILEIQYDKWLELKETDRFWDQFLVALVEKGFSIKEKRERDLLLLDAETRYKNFLNEFPGLEKRIKQHIIASYLGITPESLSRIRQKKVS